MALKLKTPPATEPLTLQEVKDYLRLVDTADDALLNSMIPAVRQKCEEYTRRALITQTWVLWMDGFPRSESRHAPREGYFELPIDHFDDVKSVFEIPRPPLISVTHIKTYDTANAVTTFDAANYLVDINRDVGRIALNQGKSWPTNLRDFASVEVEFVAGYGVSSAVPDAIKEGMRMWIKLLKVTRSKLFEGDDDETGGLVAADTRTIPPQVKAMWDPYQVHSL